MEHPISAVARMVDLSTDVIRSWERRYKIVEPVRTASGVRLYSTQDVARLRLARAATRLGHPIRQVAKLSDAQLQALTERHPTEAATGSAVVARLVDAVHADDIAGASELLRAAALLMPPRELVLGILAPALREVGQRWENGTLAIWQEHVLSHHVLGVAGTLQHPSQRSARIVLATPPYERHGFGIAFAALLAAGRGVSACNLGVTVPAAELCSAARRLRASAVIVGMTQGALPETEALEYARDLDAALSPGVDIVLGGAGGTRVAAALSSPRIRAVATLEEFETLCRRWR